MPIVMGRAAASIPPNTQTNATKLTGIEVVLGLLLGIGVGERAAGSHDDATVFRWKAVDKCASGLRVIRITAAQPGHNDTCLAVRARESGRSRRRGPCRGHPEDIRGTLQHGKYVGGCLRRGRTVGTACGGNRDQQLHVTLIELVRQDVCCPNRFRCRISESPGGERLGDWQPEYPADGHHHCRCRDDPFGCRERDQCDPLQDCPCNRCGHTQDVELGR